MRPYKIRVHLTLVCVADNPGAAAKKVADEIRGALNENKSPDLKGGAIEVMSFEHDRFH